MKSKYYCDTYILLWSIYYLQVFFDIRGAISQSLFLFLVVVSLIITIYIASHKNNNKYIGALTIVLAMVSIYGAYSMYSYDYIIRPSGVITSFAYLQLFYRSILPLYVFYFFSISVRFTKYDLFRYFTYFIVITMFRFFITISWGGVSDLTNTFNVIGYGVVGLMPMVLLLTISEKRKIILLMILLGIVCISAKRGAVFIGIIVIFLFIRRSLKYNSQQQSLSTIILFAFVLVVFFNVMSDVYSNSEGMQNKVSLLIEGDSSGRDEIYSEMLTFITNQNDVLNVIFGNGADSTIKIFDIYAHNDWLEIAMNQGLLGIIIYVNYFFCFFKEWRFNNRSFNHDACVGFTLLICFISSMYSMSINNMPLGMTFALAYSIAKKTKMREELL